MVKLTRTQEGALRYMAGQSGIDRTWGKPTVQTYRKLCALGLLEQSDAFPYHRATDSGHDWIVAKDGAVDRMLETMAPDQIRGTLGTLAGLEPGRFGWNVGRTAAVLRELDRRAGRTAIAELMAQYRGRLTTSEMKRIKYQGQEFDCIEFRIGSKLGLRAWIRHNVATGQLDYRVIQGDGTTHRFWLYEYSKKTTPEGVADMLRRLHEGHFDGAEPIDRVLDND